MSGYNYTTYRSNNAEQAIEDGLITAGEVVKKLNKEFKIKISVDILIANCPYTEKHHTSSYYNWTYYFDGDDFDKAFEWAKNNQDKYLANAVKIQENIEITYPNWGGSKKRPYIAYYTTAKAVKDGTWARLPDGSKKSINGTAVSWKFI